MATESADSYIGSLISLISKYEIRYEGVLYFLSVQDSSIGLKNVRSYGTEGRKKDGPQVPPNDKVYEYILFRASDIKDLQVKSHSPAQREEQTHDDPAIIQSHYAGVPVSSPPSALVGGKNLVETTHWQDTPALTSRGHIGILPSYNSAIEVGTSGHPSNAHFASPPALSFPMYWQGYNGASLDMSDNPHHHIPLQYPSAVSQSLTMQNMAPENHASIAIGLATTSECLTPKISSSTPTFVHPNFSTSVSPVHFSSGLDMPTSLAAQISLPSHSIPLNASRLTMSSLPSPCQDLDKIETQMATKAVSDSVPVPPAQSMPYPGSFSVGSDRGPLLTPPPSLLTPDQLAPSRSDILSSSQKLFRDGKDMGILMPTSSGSPSLIPPVSQAPLLPLPTSQQSPYSATQYTEEFDFLAMNEKFKKDEVWGYLGKEKQSDQTERADNSGTGQCVDDKEGSGLIPSTKPAYNKDEFFDTISCNSLNRGGRNGHRFSERVRQDTETFGNFQQRYNPGYGGYGSGLGGNYRGPYKWGRGYRYGGRERGGNMPF